METVTDLNVLGFILKQTKHGLKSFSRFLIYRDVERYKCFTVQDFYKVLEVYDKEEKKYLNIS